MSEFIRSLSLDVDGVMMTDLRMTVKGRAFADLAPDTFVVEVWNLSLERRSVIKRGSSAKVVGSTGSILLEGKVQDIQTTIEDGSRRTVLEIVDGLEFSTSHVSCSIIAPCSVGRAIDSVMRLCSYPIPYSANIQSMTEFPRGLVFHGRTTDAIKQIGQTIGVRFYLSRGLLRMIQTETQSPELEITDSIVAGTPVEQDGISTMRIMPYVAPRIGAACYLNTSTMQGIRYCVMQEIDADTNGGAWRFAYMFIDPKIIRVTQ